MADHLRGHNPGLIISILFIWSISHILSGVNDNISPFLLLDSLLPPYIPTPRPCDDPELEAIITHLVSTIPPSIVPMLETAGSGSVLQYDAETIHTVTCLYVGNVNVVLNHDMLRI